jgi:glycosyltransferase involved in cell wall biosynthesis
LAEPISVIVTTYNREDALDAVLRSLSRQRDRDFEVIVADDGSTSATAELIEQRQARFGAPLRHVWQEQRGFRAGEARNRAVAASLGSYCVFLDGDCLVRSDFIATHRRLAEPGYFVTGNRALMSQSLTADVLQRRLEPEAWRLPFWISHRIGGGLNRLGPLMALPLGPLRKLRSGKWQGARSCNLAVWRADFDRVDGFDAIFNGWGKEDSDLLVRLLHAGVRRKDGTFATGVLHLWHPEADRSHLQDNEQRLAEVIASRRIRAVSGMSTLLG